MKYYFRVNKDNNYKVLILGHIEDKTNGVFQVLDIARFQTKDKFIIKEIEILDENNNLVAYRKLPEFCWINTSCDFIYEFKWTLSVY